LEASSRNLHGRQFAAGGMTAFMLLDSVADLTEPEAGSVVLGTVAGEARTEVLVIEKDPVLLASPQVVEVWQQGRAGRKDWTIEIVPDMGKILLLAAQLDGLPGATLDDTSLLGGRVVPDERGAGGRLELRIEAAKLGEGNSTVQILVAYEASEGPGTAKVDLGIHVRRAPQFRWAEQNRDPKVLYQTDGQEMRLTFHNQNPDGTDSGLSNAMLEIRSMRLIPPADSGIVVELNGDEQVTLAGGASREVTFLVDFTGMKAQTNPFVEFRLELRTNMLTELVKRPVTVEVRKLPQFAGIVAIDFGSSNTCCAVVEEGSEPRILALEKGEQAAPTVIRYLDMTKKPPEVQVGSVPKEDAAMNGQIAAGVADRLKQRLRARNQEKPLMPQKPPRWVMRKASDEAGDYLKVLRRVAERTQMAIFETFILTHPARCPLRQHRRLTQALQQAFGTEKDQITFLPEPIAALLPLIKERAERVINNSYTVASFDVGGGTTDVAVLRVQYAEVPGGVEIRPNILTCRGANFGGEDLTDFLVGALQTRCAASLAQEQPGAVLITEQTTAAAEYEKRRNLMALRNAAEKFKASLSGMAGSAAPRRIDLFVRQPDGDSQIQFFDFDTIQKQGSVVLTQEFVAHTWDRVGAVAQMLMVTEGEVDGIDVIQLSGRTAALSVVREAVVSTMPGVPEVITAPETKECVVKGACLSQSMRFGTVRLNLGSAGHRMTSTVGVFSVSSSTFEPMLRVDEVIPPKGLVRMAKEVWDGRGVIRLWESLHGSGEEVEYSAARHAFGEDADEIWEPERRLSHPAESFWSLELRIANFELSVTAIGPQGERVAFRPREGYGD